MQISLNYAAVAVVAGAIAAAPGTARAEYPDHPITIVVGTGAGGAADAGARMVGKEMEKILGQPIVVVNKVGGGGTKALALLRNEKPDGYSLVYAFSHHITFGGQYKRKKPLFKATDFDYVGSITEPRQSLVSLTGRGWTTFKGMVEKLKAENQPIRLVYSGGPGRLVGTALHKTLNYPVKVIRVRGGGKSMQLVLGGHVDIAFSGGAHAKYTEAGKTDGAGERQRRRGIPTFPNAPTLKELGIPRLHHHFAGAGRPEGRAKGGDGQAERRVGQGHRRSQDRAALPQEPEHADEEPAGQGAHGLHGRRGEALHQADRRLRRQRKRIGVRRTPPGMLRGGAIPSYPSIRMRKADLVSAAVVTAFGLLLAARGDSQLGAAARGRRLRPRRPGDAERHGDHRYRARA